jgi:hypothetical protein
VAIDNTVVHYLPKSVNGFPAIPLKFTNFSVSEDQFTYYVLKKPEGKVWDEAFIILPLINNPEKCLVYFFSSFKPGISKLGDKPAHPLVESFIQDSRMMFLSDLRAYTNSQPVNKQDRTSRISPLKKNTINRLVTGS